MSGLFKAPTWRGHYNKAQEKGMTEGIQGLRTTFANSAIHQVAHLFTVAAKDQHIKKKDNTNLHQCDNKH